MQVLEDVIKYRWKALSKDQREGIRSYLVTSIIKLSSDEATMRAEHTLLGKLNVALVQVLKHEWPTNWPAFIPEIVAASK